MSDNSLERNIYYGRVLDNDDPLMLGRIRVHPDIENLPALESAVEGFDKNSQNPDNGKWSIKDPLIFLPLLPYFVNQVPKIGERVLILYFNNSKQNLRDRFYLIRFENKTPPGFRAVFLALRHIASVYFFGQRNRQICRFFCFR